MDFIVCVCDDVEPYHFLGAHSTIHIYPFEKGATLVTLCTASASGIVVVIVYIMLQREQLVAFFMTCTNVSCLIHG
jgi:hypothetical protein